MAAEIEQEYYTCQRNTNQEEYGDENEKPLQELELYKDVDRPRPIVDCVAANGLRKFNQRKPEKCKKSKKGQCEKNSGHTGKCKLVVGKNKFWEFSRSHKIHELKEREAQVKRKRIEEEHTEIEKVRLIGDSVLAEVQELKEKVVTEQKKLDEVKENLSDEKKLFENKKLEIMEDIKKMEEAQVKEKEILKQLKEAQGNFESVRDLEQKIVDRKSTLVELNNEYNKVKLVFEQKGYSRKRRENNSSTFKMITDRNCSTRFERKKETKVVLEYIHGGKFGALLGAWDFLQTGCDKELIDKFISGYKNGKFMEQKLNELTKKFETGDEALRKAIVVKYENFLSRRKYKFLSKTMDSFYDPNRKT